MPKFNIVYKTTNLINGKIYVGKHTQLDTSTFDGYLGSGKLLMLSIKKYGNENFIRETLEVCETEELAYRAEIYWIYSLLSTDRNIGYNIDYGGFGFSNKRLKELWKDPVYKNKQSEATRINWSNEEFRLKQSKLIKLSKNSLEYRTCASNFFKELWKDPVYREKMLIIINSNQNKKLRLDGARKMWDETDYREKFSKHMKNKWQDEEFKKKMKESCTEEVRRKISESQMGDRNHNKKIEVRQKISLSVSGSKNPAAKFKYKVKDPSGEIWETDCLKLFCKEHNLNVGNLIGTLNGSRSHNKGWILIYKQLREDV